ncbi:Whirlin [Melipona quadrifasciata]|uniref:Whirlin n=1 Tax=Melipona quadrifasciata TaxID=166423 RepID=A0A0M9A4Q5_9HYME|nr:Whirlin [Melipona quadrifasciata]
MAEKNAEENRVTVTCDSQNFTTVATLLHKRALTIPINLRVAIVSVFVLTLESFRVLTLLEITSLYTKYNSITIIGALSLIIILTHNCSIDLRHQNKIGAILYAQIYKLQYRIRCNILYTLKSDKTDPKGMASSTEDYGSELQELQWGGGSGSHFLRSGTHFLRSGTGGCYEAEDLEPTSRHHGGQHRGYYSPPGTSYTIVERPPSAPHHHSSHTTPYRHRGHATGGSGAISPEQVLSVLSVIGAGKFAVRTERVVCFVDIEDRQGRVKKAQHIGFYEALYSVVLQFLQIPRTRLISTTDEECHKLCLPCFTEEYTVLKLNNQWEREVLVFVRKLILMTKNVKLACKREINNRANNERRDELENISTRGKEKRSARQDISAKYPALMLLFHLSTQEPNPIFYSWRFHEKPEGGVGVYISRVEEGSVAERAGLRPGDTILEVNGTPFRAVTHEEALKLRDFYFNNLEFFSSKEGFALCSKWEKKGTFVVKNSENLNSGNIVQRVSRENFSLRDNGRFSHEKNSLMFPEALEFQKQKYPCSFTCYTMYTQANITANMQENKNQSVCQFYAQHKHNGELLLLAIIRKRLSKQEFSCLGGAMNRYILKTKGTFHCLD